MPIFGIIFIKTIVGIRQLKIKYCKKYDFIYLLAIILITGFTSLYSKSILGDGVPTINNLLLGKSLYLISTLSILFISRLFLTTASYSTGLSGGIFIPVLYIGALGGALFANLLIEFGVPNIQIPIFALLGMATLLIAVIKAPFTAFFLIFEITKDYDLMLPLMISCITAYYISNLYTKKIYLRTYC